MMEEEESEREIVIHELPPDQFISNQETLTINLEDVHQIILQGENGEASVQGAVPVSPGTYQILTQDGIQQMAQGPEDTGVTQIEVPINMFQEAVDMLHGQDIQHGSVEAAIANLAARHLESQAATTTSDNTEEILNIPQSDMDNSTAGLLESAIEGRTLPDIENRTLPETVEFEAFISEDNQEQHVIHVTQSQATLLRPGMNVETEPQTITQQNPFPEKREMVSILKKYPAFETESSSESASVTFSTTMAVCSTTPSVLYSAGGNVNTLNSLTNPVHTAEPKSPQSSIQELVDSENSLDSNTQLTSSEVTQLTNRIISNSVNPTPTEPQAKNAASLGSVRDSADTTPTPPPLPHIPDKKPDYSAPIELEEYLQITVGSKKCIILPHPDKGTLFAFPLIPIGGKRKRGRPKKEIKVEPDEIAEGYAENKENVAKGEGLTEIGVESQADAAESLLELSNTGPDGVRRSGRKRKKAKTLKDYSILKLRGSSDEESVEESEDEFRMSDLDVLSDDDLLEDTDDDEYQPNGTQKKRKNIDYSANPTLLLRGGKRGPGRPRRSPYPGQPTNPAQIPAILVNGQTIMIQGLGNLNQGKSVLTPLLPKPTGGNHGGDIGDRSSSVGTENLDTAQSGSQNMMEIPTSVTQTPDGQATILQFPEDVVNMLTKKDPLKLGLKAPETDLEKLKCTLCDFQAFYQQQFKEHLETHSDEHHRCKCCHHVTLNEEDLIQHYKTEHPRSICTICNFTTEQPYVLKRHMSRHDEKTCTCTICGKVYKDQYIMKMHVKLVHMPAEELFECTTCGKKFTRKAHLKRHYRTHSTTKPFKCPLCEYRGGERSDVSKHMLIHEEPKHTCEICGKAFRHIKNKELHVKRHSGQKDYKCGLCGTYGYTFSEIRKHIERRHCDLNNTAFVCEKCGTSFQDDDALTEHCNQGCDPLTLEQALSITTTEGEAGHATIQIPASVLQGEGQAISYDGQHLTIGGNQVNITVQQLGAEEESIMLTEEELAEAQIAVTDGESQVITTAELVTEMVEAGLRHVTEADQETVSLEEGVVITAPEAENNIILAKEDGGNIVLV